MDFQTRLCIDVLYVDIIGQLGHKRTQASLLASLYQCQLCRWMCWQRFCMPSRKWTSLLCNTKKVIHSRKTTISVLFCQNIVSLTRNWTMFSFHQCFMKWCTQMTYNVCICSCRTSSSEHETVIHLKALWWKRLACLPCLWWYPALTSCCLGSLIQWLQWRSMTRPACAPMWLLAGKLRRHQKPHFKSRMVSA